MCYEIMVVEIYFITIGSMLLLFISLCFHHRAFHRMFQQWINDWNTLATDENNNEFLRNLHVFHNRVKGLV